MQTTPLVQYELSTYERGLLHLDQYPWGALYRIGIGYAMPFLYYRVSSNETPDWFILVWFLGTLMSLRVLPAVFRKLLPFGGEIKRAWIERRMLTKLYDSYQWRKLIWFGIGLVAYVISSGVRDTPIFALAVFCLLSGTIGTIFWRKRTAEGISLSGMSDVWIGTGRRL